MKQVPCDKKVVLFGELMMRLSTKRHERIVQAREFDVIYSGAEANLGVALQAMGIDSFMVSSVPDNAVGEACLCYLRQFQLNLDNVRKKGDRLGIYYVETGAAQRPSTFLYNRKGSSITELRPGDFNWDEIFAGKHWFHFTGITPALADSVADAAPVSDQPVATASPALRPSGPAPAAEPMNFFERHSTRLAGHYIVWGYCLLLLLDLAWMAYRVWRRVQQVRNPPIKG